MLRPTRILLIAIRIGAIALFISAGTLGRDEYRSSLQPRDMLQALATDGPPAVAFDIAALSTAAQVHHLDDCALVQMDLATTLFGTDERNHLASACLDLADQVLARSPTSSIAHFAAAVSALQLGQDQRFHDAYTAAQMTAPSEGWLASRRMSLGFATWPSLTPENRTALDRDLQLMLNSPVAIAIVASHYLRQPRLQQSILATVEQQPLLVQRAFLNAVRTISASDGKRL